MPRTLETIFAEWKALDTAYAAMADESPELDRAYKRMNALEIEMRDHPARNMREAAMKLEPYFVNTERDPNFTGVLEDLRAHLEPSERVVETCPDFTYCARVGIHGKSPASAA